MSDRRFLYLTADTIGNHTGGGKVTYHEREALSTLGDVITISRSELGQCADPWGWDEKALEILQKQDVKFDLAHVYSGTFSKTAAYLKERGTKIVWTIAAHDKEVSKEEHEKYGGGFPYKHLTDSALWNAYITGYRLSDVIICPSSYSKGIVEGYGGCSSVRVITHGCDPVKNYIECSPKFVVGYLGSIGFDKGLIYLCQAWKKASALWAAQGVTNTMLLLAGKDSTNPFMSQIWNVYGGGNVTFAGWQRDLSYFYNKISLYCQPSATEGFGLEILEAMAHGRAVITSTNCGGPDVIEDYNSVFEARNVDSLVGILNSFRLNMYLGQIGVNNRIKSEQFTWDIIKKKYIQLWEEYL